MPHPRSLVSTRQNTASTAAAQTSSLQRIDLEKLQPLHLISQPDHAKPVGGFRFSRPEKCQRNNRHAIGPAERLRAG